MVTPEQLYGQNKQTRPQTQHLGLAGDGLWLRLVDKYGAYADTKVKPRTQGAMLRAPNQIQTTV